ncbi:MAG TPA: helix-turn-helix transcriptional regulator [Bacillota bacterium]|nr:helix-turn-helix transcriptional regulator [Bacillota bacterium]
MMLHNESYTTEEIAQLLKVSKLTIYDLIKKGELRAYRVGRQMRIDAVDLEAYKRKGKAVKMEKTSGETNDDTRSIIISGQDSSLDVFSRALEKRTDSYKPLRSQVGSLDSLINMYNGRADIVSTHLLDGETGTYNVPYVKRLLVSHSFVVVKFIKRQAGLYVAKDNPKNIFTWADLKREDVRIVNREQGAGSRVLLDEQLKKINVHTSLIRGYDHIQTSHLSVAAAIANEAADVGVGIEQPTKLANIDFVPLITENYDLVMLKTEENNHLIEEVLRILRDDSFQNELNLLGYDTENIGDIIYEQ